MDPKIALKLTDLRRRILENERNGRPSHDGITPEEYREAIDALRGNRAAAGAKGAAVKKAAAKKKSKAPSANLASILADLGD